MQIRSMQLMKGSNRGFTLIEIMVVVVILGILASMIVPKIMGRPEQAKIVKAKQDILAIENALDLYKLDNSTYPTNDQGLSALVSKPTTDPIPDNWKSGGYLKAIPVDPWGHPYQYTNPGQHSEVDVFSYGPKGTGSPANEWIGNWATNKMTEAQP